MKKILCGNRAEGHVDTGIKIIIAVVIGALLLGGLYLLFSTVILPRMNSEVEEMMDYTQELRYERTYDEAAGVYTLRYSYDGKHWSTPTMPDYGESATVYGTMSNCSDTDPIEGNQLYADLRGFAFPHDSRLCSGGCHRQCLPDPGTCPCVRVAPVRVC